MELPPTLQEKECAPYASQVSIPESPKAPKFFGFIFLNYEIQSGHIHAVKILSRGPILQK